MQIEEGSGHRRFRIGPAHLKNATLRPGLLYPPGHSGNIRLGSVDDSRIKNPLEAVALHDRGIPRGLIGERPKFIRPPDDAPVFDSFHHRHNFCQARFCNAVITKSKTSKMNPHPI